MFYIFVICYFLLEIIFSQSFGEPIYKDFYIHGGYLQHCLFCLSILFYMLSVTKRKFSTLLLLVMYSLFTTIADCFIGNITSVYYIIEVIPVFFWTMSIIFRIYYCTAKTINHNNILLAFYKGEKGSLIMKFFELFGVPVKSMCILAGDKALYLKARKKTFEFGDSAKIHKKYNDYIIIDTGVEHTEKFIDEMREHSKVIATKSIFRIRCIEGVSDLLAMIGNDYIPKTYIPSLYLRGLINA